MRQCHFRSVDAIAPGRQINGTGDCGQVKTLDQSTLLVHLVSSTNYIANPECPRNVVHWPRSWGAATCPTRSPLEGLGDGREVGVDDLEEIGQTPHDAARPHGDVGTGRLARRVTIPVQEEGVHADVTGPKVIVDDVIAHVTGVVRVHLVT